MTDGNVNPYNSQSSISPSMLARVKAGDQEAWNRLVDMYSRLVYWWCRKKGVDPQSARDVGQEVFMAAYRYKDNFERTRPGDSFRGWLRKITNSKIADYYKRRGEEPVATGGSTAIQLFQESEFDNADEDINPSQETQVLFAAVLDLIRNEFSERDWTAFRKVVVDGQTPSATASEMGISRNQVYLAKSRILHRVREHFGDDPDAMPTFE